MASGARLWHKRTMEAELDLDQASRETLLEIIAELRQWVESLEARLSSGGPGARMPGRQAQEAGGAGEEAAKEASARLRPDADGTRRAGGPRPGVLPRRPHHPERGLGAADPGGHRTSGVSCRSYRTRLHRPEVSAVPETESAPGPSERSGCRPPAPGGQPRIQYGAGSVKPDSDPAGRGPAARKDHPMVSANVPSSI